ncbi:MAG: hypothetical protein GY719_26260 [bacterium]|nr:hypothetical protein [bacterium]
MSAQDTANLIGSHLRHWAFVRLGLLKIRQDLERRGEEHDLSKLNPDDELAGFSRINATAREHPYGSDEYKAALAAEQPTIASHYGANSHHPEHHRTPAEMGWLDLVEMVCDWKAAQMAYGRQSWSKSMQVNRGRWGGKFTAGQWWLIEQVAAFLDDAPETAAALRDGDDA